MAPAASSTRLTQTSCRLGGTMRATPQPWRRSDADQNAGKEGQQWQNECSAEAATAVGGAGCGGRLGPTAPGPGGEQDVGVHPLTQPAEPGDSPAIYAIGRHDSSDRPPLR